MNSTPGDPIDAVKDAALKVLPVDEEQADMVADRVRALDQRARAFVREYPVATVLGAVALGYLLGRVIRG
jgi:hypothetical protein